MADQREVYYTIYCIEVEILEHKNRQEKIVEREMITDQEIPLDELCSLRTEYIRLDKQIEELELILEDNKELLKNLEDNATEINSCGEKYSGWDEVFTDGDY
jgi:hypothetical protein